MRAGIAASLLSLYLTNATPIPATLPVADSAVLARDVLSFGDPISSSLGSRKLELYNPIMINAREVPGHSSGSSLLKRTNDQETNLYRRGPTLDTIVDNLYSAFKSNPERILHGLLDPKHSMHRDLVEDMIVWLNRSNNGRMDDIHQKKMFYCLWSAKVLVGGAPTYEAVALLKKWEDAARAHSNGHHDQGTLMQEINSSIRFFANLPLYLWRNRHFSGKYGKDFRELVQALLKLEIKNLSNVDIGSLQRMKDLFPCLNIVQGPDSSDLLPMPPGGWHDEVDPEMKILLDSKLYTKFYSLLALAPYAQIV
ncbi:hypothetical protein H0H93_007289 [Arthromyces matolae]|nr:hypothetical protein H0H93_007289 [Arthromyces matolae]